ncbi:hypothetical protein [Actinomadura rupiterrae]|uniref:hypothetical protein n=1 Tax=Actinomadura rupiterrae TaxID=559627 RepID=UPI0020A3718C|nr:hypothetical protein [Actinomadura rupiterrae]MCP2343082.1 hypothetical protein [Actinomadura rupiterrae]
MSDREAEGQVADDASAESQDAPEGIRQGGNVFIGSAQSVVQLDTFSGELTIGEVPAEKPGVFARVWRRVFTRSGR